MCEYRLLNKSGNTIADDGAAGPAGYGGVTDGIATSQPNPRRVAGDGLKSIRTPAGEDDGWPGQLGKVEVFREITQLRCILAYAGTRIATAVSCRIEPRAAKEIVFDEFVVGVEAEDLV